MECHPLLRISSEMMPWPNQCSLQHGDNVDLYGLYYSGEWIEKKSSISNMRMVIFSISVQEKKSWKLTPCSKFSQRWCQGQTSAFCRMETMLISMGYTILENEFKKSSISRMRIIVFSISVLGKHHGSSPPAPNLLRDDTKAKPVLFTTWRQYQYLWVILFWRMSCKKST